VTSNTPAIPLGVPYDFRLDMLRRMPCFVPFTTSRDDKHTHSETRLAWILDELAHGKDAMKLTRKLAAYRADKPNPLYYAQRTVDAIRQTLVIEAFPWTTFVTMLVVRPPLRDSHRTLLRSCAGDRTDGAEEIARRRSLDSTPLDSTPNKGEEMPLLEINLSRYISALFGWTRSTGRAGRSIRRFRPRIRRRCGGRGAQLRLLEGPRFPGLSEDATGQASCLYVAGP